MDDRLPEVSSLYGLKDLLDSLDLLTEAAEVGVAEGLFSRELGGWGFSRIYLVDQWRSIQTAGASMLNMDQDKHDQNYAAVQRLVSEKHGLYQVLRGDSVAMSRSVPDGALGFCFIDATHQYEFVLADLRAWWPKLCSGGVVACHDYLNTTDYTVKQAADEFARQQGVRLHVIAPHDPVNACCWFRKP